MEKKKYINPYITSFDMPDDCIIATSGEGLGDQVTGGGDAAKHINTIEVISLDSDDDW